MIDEYLPKTSGSTSLGVERRKSDGTIKMSNPLGWELNTLKERLENGQPEDINFKDKRDATLIESVRRPPSEG